MRNIIFILFLLNILYQINARLIDTAIRDNVQYNDESNTCKFIFFMRISSDSGQPVHPNNITLISPPSPSSLAVSYLSIDDIITLYTSVLTTLTQVGDIDFDAEIQILYPNGSLEVQTITGFKCLEMDLNQFNISKMHYPQFNSEFNYIQVALDLDFEPSISTFENVQCTSSVPGFSCLFMNGQYLKYSTIQVMSEYGYDSLSPTIPITLNFRNRLLNLTIDNLYPFNVNRTTKVVSCDTYPSNGVTVYEDITRRSIYQLVNLLTVETPNSLFYIVFSLQFATSIFNYILVATNSTHSTYYQTNNLYNQRVDVYMKDRNTTVIRDNIEVSFVKDNTTGTTSGQFDNFQMNNTLLLSTSFEVPVIYKTNLISNINQQDYFSIFFTYPYQYNYNTGNYTYSFVLPILNYISKYNIYVSYELGGNLEIPIVGRVTKDPMVILNDITLTGISRGSSLVRLNISSNCQIRSLAFGDYKGYPSQTIVYGDYNDGIYEFEYFASKPQYQISIYDHCERVKNYMSRSFYDPLSSKILPEIPSSNIYNVFGYNITYMKFSSNNVDVLNSDVNLTLYFNLTNPIKDLEPMFGINNIFEPTYRGYFSESLGHYVINFTIKKGNLMGPLKYELYIGQNTIPSDFINSYIGEDSHLNVINSNADLVSPMIKDINAKFGLNVNISANENKTIGWDLRITDYPNGFKYGKGYIISDIDLWPREFTFDQRNLTSGDIYDGVYSILFSVNGVCRSQTFTIINLTLFDNSPSWESQFINYDPFVLIFGTPSESQLKIKVNCLNTMFDIIAPELISFDFTKEVDVGKINRLVEFNLTIKDEINGSGVSLRHNPIITLTSENTNYMEIQCNLSEIISDSYKYSGSVQLPFAFGLNNIIVAVYGLVDNYNNYRAYTSIDLKNQLFPYYIKRNFTLIEPILERSTELTSKGGSLIVYGRSFGINNQSFISLFDFKDGKGYQPIPLDLYSGIILQFKSRIPPITSNQITMKVIKDGVSSNELIIPIRIIVNPTTSPNVTITPSSTPQKCLGTPECNNHGTCINSICQCNLPWYGPSCSSQVQINPPPTPNPEPSTGTNITQSGFKISSSIEIVGVREMNSNMEVVETFNISSWNFTDQTISNISNPKFHYSTQLKSRSTILNVTIEYFRNTTNITFADEELLLPASTIKFTMNLNSYSFQSSTNFIQILMKSTIESDQSNVCSSIGVGNEDGSVQWIKLNIDDRSLYGRFLSKGVIDNVVRPIQNLIIEDNQSEQTKQFRSATVGITIPKYENSVFLDPDFSNLIDVDSKDTANEICPKSKKLSNGAIAGIVVGVLIFISAIIAIILYVKKRTIYKKQELKMKRKLESMNKNK